MNEFEKPRMALLSLAEYKETLERLRRLEKLCSLAADALEFWMKDLASTEQQYVDAAMRDERLLAELRKGC